MSALRWGAVDFDKRELTVRNNLVRGEEGTPKGGVTRNVPMSGRLHRALAQHHAAEGGSRGRVLKREDGSDMTTDRGEPSRVERRVRGRRGDALARVLRER